MKPISCAIGIVMLVVSVFATANTYAMMLSAGTQAQDLGLWIATGLFAGIAGLVSLAHSNGEL